MKVSVTREHIKKGLRFNYVRCPITLAIREALNTSDVFTFHNEVKIKGIWFDLPDSARAFIHYFDTKKKPVEPFEFEIFPRTHDNQRQQPTIV